MSGRPEGNPLADAETRREAASSFDVNLVVVAGAGTGKTSLLVERALIAIGSGVTEITRLAAITFTEKAAGEMRARISKGLDRLRALARGDAARTAERTEGDRAFEFLRDEAGIPPREIAARAVDALESLDRAVIVTIHSFCSELLRGHAVEAGVDPGFAVDSGELEGALLEEMWERFAERELGPEGSRRELWRELLERVSLGDAGRICRELAGFRFPSSLFDSPRDVTPSREMFRTLAERLARETDSLLERAEGMTAKTEGYFRSMRAAYERLAEEGLDAFVRHVEADADLARRIDGRNAPDANKKLTGVPPTELRGLGRRLLRLAERLTRADDRTVRRILEVAAPFAREFREAYLRQGWISFDGLLMLTRDLLRDEPRVREELKQRFRMLLVDEFQDTDPLQYEIVLLLAEKAGGSAGDPYRAELEPGRLFIVGDPKQSIYRFRGADYSAYRSAVGRIEEQGGRVRDLTTNFRSLRGVVDPVNRLFEPDASSAWRASPHQPEYRSIEAHRSRSDPSPRVELWTVEGDGDTSAEERRKAEGRLIAEEIERLVAGGEARYRDLSILLRSFGSLSVYLRALRERGVPFVVSGGREFLKRPEVAQLMATLRALAMPADAAALLAFLRSPAGGLTDAELALHTAGGGVWDWRTEPDAERTPLLADRFSLLRRIDAETRHLPADSVVRRVVERTLMLPLSAAAFEGAQRVANLRKLASAAGELARDGRLSLEQVVEALGEEGVARIDEDSPLADESGNAVRVSTIHGMKGLENRVVFLPDLARGSLGSPTPPFEVAVPVGPDGEPLPAIKVGETYGSAWALRAEEDRLHDEAEEIRVLYVALTRARDRLVLLAGASGRAAPMQDALAPWGYSSDSPPDDGERLADGRVLHRLRRPAAVPAPRSAVQVSGADGSVSAYAQALDAVRSSLRAPFAAPSADDEDRDRSEETEHGAERIAPRSRDLGRVVGNLLHRLLEHWDGSSGPELLERARSLSRPTADETGLDPGELEREAVGILNAFLGSDLAERFGRVEIVGRELTLLSRGKEGELYRGSIDLLYRDRRGNLVVADFKTDRETDRSLLRKRYGRQLSVYAKAVAGALGLPESPRAELWMLRSGDRVEL